MSDSTPIATSYDLRAVAKLLRNKACYKRFASLVDRVHAITSAANDLKASRASAQMLADNFIESKRPGQEMEQTAEEQTIGRALFMSAVMFYARATDTTSNARKPTGLRDRLPPELKATHKRMMELRNDALAHYGPAGDQWAGDGVVLTVVEGNARLKSPWFFYNYRAEDVLSLLEVVGAAEQATASIRVERGTELLEHVTKLFAEDEAFVAALHSCPFEPEKFFHGKDAVEAAVQNLRGPGQMERATVQPAEWRSQRQADEP